MKGIVIQVFIMCLTVLVSAVTTVASTLNDTTWRLINEDAKGNKLYVAPVPEKSAEKKKQVWVKYEAMADNSPSPMLFLNELDCSQNLIKRLEVKLYQDTGSGEKLLFRNISFDGKWDRPAAGIEQMLYETICSAADKDNL